MTDPSRPQAPAVPAFAPHDHASCRETALARARAVCRARGVRLTPIRERVLSILLESHAALGAYDVLRKLVEQGAEAQPPTAYRALDFLVANGLAHRIERLNAFVACTAADPGPPAEEAPHEAAFLICGDCGMVAERPAPGLDRGLAQAAETAGFAVERAVVEVMGTCADCRSGASAGERSSP